MKSRVNPIPPCHHILSAVQLAGIDALLSAETENKGKFHGSQQSRMNQVSLHLPVQPLYPTMGPQQPLPNINT